MVSKDACSLISRTALPPTLRLPEDQLAWTDDVLLRCHEYYKVMGSLLYIYNVISNS